MPQHNIILADAQAAGRKKTQYFENNASRGVFHDGWFAGTFGPFVPWDTPSTAQRLKGWDANKVNVLVDLTTVTTSMSVNQLRGRSIRLDPHDPLKLANNWESFACPEFSKGLDDYHRFIEAQDAVRHH
jgi:hypothetical protein